MGLREKLLLYAVTDRAWLGARTLCEQVEEALKGGVTFVQLREKELDHDSVLAEARALKELCARYSVPFVVNDAVDIALAVDADGVHVGQSDMEAGDVRALLGPDKLLGVSCQTVEQALLAQRRGADYLGVGAMFPTGTKTDAAEVSMDTLRDICRAVDIPVVVIGGIKEDNLPLFRGIGIAGAAVVSAIFAREDMEGAARGLREAAAAVVSG